MLAPMAASVHQEILSNLQNYESKAPMKQDSKLKDNNTATGVLHSPSNSETSSLFSTVDCSSFSSRSDASSFVKEEVSLATPSVSVSVCSSVEFTSSSSRSEETERLSGNKTDTADSGYLEFSFLEGKLVENEDKVLQVKGTGTGTGSRDPSSSTSQTDDVYETFPVWTDRTRYCSKDIHTCMNPCFDQTRGDGSETGTLRNSSRKKKLAKSLGSVLTRHLVFSPGPTFRRSSYEKFRSRLGLDHPSPLVSEHSDLPLTPSRTFDGRVESGYSSSPSPKCVTKYVNSPRLSFSREKVKLKPAGELSACSTSGKSNLYGTSPRRGFDSKSLGCLRGISAGGTSRAPAEDEDEASADHYNGALYIAADETVHGGIGRCLPSPRLSFGLGKATTAASKQEESAERRSASMSMRVPCSTVRGHLHCMVKNELPCFTFFADGLEEVLIAKGVRSGSGDGLEAGGEVTYSFYSWKPRGRARGQWRSWVRKDKTLPDLVGRMVLTSRVVPAESKDGNDEMELEFVLSNGTGTCSPRLSFSTWETGASPLSSCRTPSPACYGFPSPYSAVSPSPGRLTYATSSRYVSMSMVPPNLTSSSPRIQLPRQSKKAHSPLRMRSDDEKSCYNDAWSDSEVTEAPEVREQSELAAVVVRVAGSYAHSAWGSPKLSHRSGSTRKSCSYYRRFSLPGKFQTTETKENQEENKSRSHKRTPSMKLRELMGVKPDFGKEEGPSNVNGDDRSTVTVVLPAGHHGIPLAGTGGPQPLVERWRAGGRCDCGSWDLGCGLTILEGLDVQTSPDSLLKISSQGKGGSPTLNLGTEVEGLFPVSFEAPFSYLQAFGSCVAALYCRGPRVLDCESRRNSVSKPPRIPLRPLSSQRRIAALAGYCSPPRVDRL